MSLNKKRVFTPFYIYVRIKKIKIDRDRVKAYMRTYLLNGLWQLNGNGIRCEGKIPGSVLSFFLDNNVIDDPFYRDNEDKAFAVLNHEYDFSREFELTEIKNEMFLCCDGLDTLATIYLNDKLVAKTKNMHRAVNRSGKL